MRPADLPTMSPHAVGTELRELAEAMRQLDERTKARPGPQALDELVRLTVERLPGASCAGLSVLRNGRLTTEASSDETARRADRIQAEVGGGPSLTTDPEDAVYLTGDAAADDRWSAWGRRLRDELGVRSVFSQRLALLDEEGLKVRLNAYGETEDAFDEAAVGAGLVVSTHAALLLSAALSRSRVDNLRRALESNREIGVAMGILMQQHRLTREQAFDVLRVASQDSNRKLASVATDVADTGTLPIRRPRRPALQPDPLA